MKKFFLYAIAILSLVALLAAKPSKRQVVFETALHCEKCVEKVRENISFERGVVDLEVKLSDKTVRIVYSAAKTDTLKLGNALRKLGYKARVLEDKQI